MATVQRVAKPARKKLAIKAARKQLATKAARKAVPASSPARPRGTTRFDLSPQWAVVKRSTIEGAGLGLFAAQDIPAEFELGEYVGTVNRGLEITSPSAYIWEVKPRHPRFEGEKIWIDGEEYGAGLLHDTPNNLRYVNAADEEDEINTKMVQREDKVYYRTTRRVHKGEELLMTYGSDYWDAEASHDKTRKKKRVAEDENEDSSVDPMVGSTRAEGGGDGASEPAHSRCYPVNVGGETEGHGVKIPCAETFTCANAGCKPDRECNWFHLFTFIEPTTGQAQVRLCKPRKYEVYKEKGMEKATVDQLRDGYHELRKTLLPPPRAKGQRGTAPQICNCVLEDIKARLGEDRPVYLPKKHESTMEDQVQALKEALPPATLAVQRPVAASELRSSVETTIAELCCPITKALPVDPVAAEDGGVYEREAIERWIEEKATSPVTNKPMGATLRPAAQVRSAVRAVARWAGERGKKVAAQMRHEEEFRTQKQLAAGGDRDAMLGVALAYADGRGVAKNKESAYRWALRAAEHGSVKALYLMPVISGHNTQSKTVVALDWQEAALRGDARACVSVARVYVGQPDDGDERAKRWYQKAAQCEPSAEGGGRFKTDDEMAKQEASEWLEAHKDGVCNWKC